MKNLSVFAVGFFAGIVFFAVFPAALSAEIPSQFPAEKPLFDWWLLWSGSWEESKTLHNRGDFKLGFLPLGLTLRGEVLDRRTLNFDLGPPAGDSWSAIWGDPEKSITQLNGALYHQSTGSRFLVGVIDEWGLSARIRNPWIRSPPYVENHKPLKADLKTAASSTKNEEAYLYLSTPQFKILPDFKLRGFASAQTELDTPAPAFSGGMDVVLPKKTGLLLEGFYTGATLPAKGGSSWFSDPPSLPERDFRLFAAGILFYSPYVSVSSDWAYSDTFAWGRDIYGNLGVTVTPILSIGRRSKPLSISLAADGAGERFVYRDGANHGAGFRTAGKIEWKGQRNSLFKANTVLRGPGLGEDFSRSSTGLYYRFPSAGNDPLRLTRITLTADRNADNPEKITDGLSGSVGFAVKLPVKKKTNNIGVNFSGNVKGLSSSDETPFPYPVSALERNFDSAHAACELTWSHLFLQFRSKAGYSAFEKKDPVWDLSFSAAARFKYGRLSLKASSPEFPKKWNWTVSWRLEIP